MEEPRDLPAHHIYQGGAAPGVECATCHASLTSGSWRRGWTQTSGQHANLCNRCGQRWVKLGKANQSVDSPGYIPSRPPKAPRPALPPSTFPHLAAGNDAKRPRMSIAVGAGLAVGPAMGLLAQLTPRPRPRLRSETTSDEEGEFSPAGVPPLPQAWPLPAPAPLRSCTSALRGKYLSYCMQKQMCGRASLALFWLQDASCANTLAVVGVDPRASGHFTYVQAPGFGGPDMPTLKCTNRGDVVAWLAAAVGVDRAQSEAAACPPTLSEEQLQQLLPGPGNRQAGAASLRAPSLRQAVEGTPQSGMDVAQSCSQPAGDSMDEDRDGAAGSDCSMDSLDSFGRRHMDRGAKIKPHPRPAICFKCGACGGSDHAAGGCPLGCCSPPALIDTLDATGLSFLDDPALQGIDDPRISLLGLEGEDSPMEDTFFDTFMDFSLPLSSPGAGSPGGVTQPPLPPPTHAALPPTSNLQHWAAAPQAPAQPSAPPATQEAMLHAWAARMGGHISDSPPPPSHPALASFLPLPWVPTPDALAILHQLAGAPVDLPLLERTHISRAVALLRTHRDPQVAAAAEGVVARWRATALAALSTGGSRA